MNRDAYNADFGGPIAMKLLQGYVWHPQTLEPEQWPQRLPMGANLALDAVHPPMAFFDNGHPTSDHVFYQLTVFEVHPDWPNNETLHQRALLASNELGLLLNATPEGVGWSINEDLRPA